MMKLEQLQERLEKVTREIWLLEMADFLRGDERNQWYKKNAEKRHLMAEIQALQGA